MQLLMSAIQLAARRVSVVNQLNALESVACKLLYITPIQWAESRESFYEPSLCLYIKTAKRTSWDKWLNEGLCTFVLNLLPFVAILCKKNNVKWLQYHERTVIAAKSNYFIYPIFSSFLIDRLHYTFNMSRFLDRQTYWTCRSKIAAKLEALVNIKPSFSKHSPWRHRSRDLYVDGRFY